MTPRIHIIPILRDNYCYLVEGADRQCLIVDPGEVSPVMRYIEAQNLTPIMILNTHHHADHIAGNAELKSAYAVSVAGPEAERKFIPGLDIGLKDGDHLDQAGLKLQVLETPGHTKGHIVFHIAALDALLCGDTLFSMGCGRLLEGTADEMFASLQKLKSLPANTNIYCGHEYTSANASFALSEEPDNETIKSRMAEVEKLRANNLPTIPVTLKTELDTNPFLRAANARIFAALRQRKDIF